MSGIIAPRMESDGSITVDMGAPILEPAKVPFDNSGLTAIPAADDVLWPLDVNGKTVAISVVSMGNPHAVQVVDNARLFRSRPMAL
jgi:diaminopimelate epimerase